MKNIKLKRVISLSLAILFTLLSVFSAFGLNTAAKDMAHEGLTYSQWYEGTIGNYYGWLLILLAMIGLCLLCWIGFVSAVHPLPPLKKRGRTAAKILCALFVMLTCAFLFRSFSSHAELKRAGEIPVDALAPYIAAYGQNRAAALAALEAAVLSFLPVIQGNR